MVNMLILHGRNGEISNRANKIDYCCFSRIIAREKLFCGIFLSFLFSTSDLRKSYDQFNAMNGAIVFRLRIYIYIYFISISQPNLIQKNTIHSVSIQPITFQMIPLSGALICLEIRLHCSCSLPLAATNILMFYAN